MFLVKTLLVEIVDDVIEGETSESLVCVKSKLIVTPLVKVGNTLIVVVYSTEYVVNV